MKTKRFRLLTVILAAVMMFALSMNVMAAKSNTVTKDGLTAQLFTDKDSYKAGESVKASVQVDNHTGKKVYVITQITAPDGVVLENANVAFDAFLENGESWKAVGGVVTSNGNATGATATAGSTTATGDNMQAGFWVILTALAVCGLFALFVYGKNRTTWLSIMLCIAMVSGMVVAAVPAQAAGVEGSISLSCTIQVDGKDEVISATVSYMSYEEDVEDTDDTAEAATPSEPRQESSEPRQESSEPSQESSEPSQESSEPSQESSESSQEPSEPSQESSEPEAVVDTLYVSASATVGAGDGSINNPFANIEEAQALIREIKDANAYPEQGITVYFRQGQYRIDIMLENVADELFISTVHLNRIMKKQIGETFLQYVTRKKMEKAVELLHDPQYKVYQVGECLGYKTPRYFSKLFYNFIGYYPSQYRKEVLKIGDALNEEG